MQVTDINLQSMAANNPPQTADAKNTFQAADAKSTVTGQIETSPANPKEDKVDLSITAQVQLLCQEGNSASEIAMKLHVDIKTVESYLKPGDSDETKVQQPYSPAVQTKAAPQSDDDTGNIQASVQTMPQNDQVKTVAQNSSEPSSVAKTINRIFSSGTSVVTGTQKL